MRLPLAIVVCLVAGAAVAQPPAPDASRAELARWLETLGGSGSPAGASLRWHYVFLGRDARAVERLSLALVGAGYEIVSLGAVGAFTELRVARVEPHTPRTLERRNREFLALAQAHSARYVGIAPR